MCTVIQAHVQQLGTNKTCVATHHLYNHIQEQAHVLLHLPPSVPELQTLAPSRNQSCRASCSTCFQVPQLLNHKVTLWEDVNDLSALDSVLAIVTEICAALGSY